VLAVTEGAPVEGGRLEGGDQGVVDGHGSS
jgi:hypothetical protein